MVRKLAPNRLYEPEPLCFPHAITKNIPSIQARQAPKITLETLLWGEHQGSESDRLISETIFGVQR